MNTHFGKAVSVCLITLALATLGWGAHAQAAEKASMRLSWLIVANFAPFYMGVDKGFYKAEGIDLSIHEGRGSSLAAQLVAQKKNTFGITDAGVLIKSIENGLPIKMIWCHTQTNPMSVLSNSAKGIRAPMDLIGKKDRRFGSLFHDSLVSSNAEAEQIRSFQSRGFQQQSAFPPPGSRRKGRRHVRVLA